MNRIDRFFSLALIAISVALPLGACDLLSEGEAEPDFGKSLVEAIAADQNVLKDRIYELEGQLWACRTLVMKLQNDEKAKD